MALVSVEEFSDWVGISLPNPDSTSYVVADSILNAIDAHLAHSYTLPSPLTDDVMVAILMQAHRLYKRRESPQGIEQAPDFGPIYVRKLDPDVERLLAPYLTMEFA